MEGKQVSQDGSSHILKISAMSSTFKSVDLSVPDQTLTCTIGDLDDGQEVTVTWRKTADGDALLNDGTNYDIVQGTVSAGGIQNSVLTIKTPILDTLSGPTFTYKCSATSSQYPESAESTQIDVVGNVFGKI